MKGLLKLGALGFGVALGLVVASRLSGQATALATGVVLGMLAGLPMGGLVLMVQRRDHKEEQRVVQGQGYPPVVVVSPSMSAPVRGETPYLSPAREYPSQRQFKIVGEEVVDGYTVTHPASSSEDHTFT